MIKYSSGIWYSHIQKKGRLMQKQSPFQQGHTGQCAGKDASFIWNFLSCPPPAIEEGGCISAAIAGMIVRFGVRFAVIYGIAYHLGI